MNQIEIIINILTLGQHFLDELESFKFAEIFFKSNTKHHAKKFIEHFEKDSNKMFNNIDDKDSVSTMYDIHNGILNHLVKLSIHDKKILLELFNNNSINILIKQYKECDK